MKKLLIFCAVLMMFAVSAVAQDATVNVSLEPSTGTVVQPGETFNLDLWLRSSDGSTIVFDDAHLLLEWDPAYVSFSGSTSTADGDYDWTTAMSFMGIEQPMYQFEGTGGFNETYTDGDAKINLYPVFAGFQGMSLPQTDLNALTLTFTASALTDRTWINIRPMTYAECGVNSGIVGPSGFPIGGIGTGATVSISEPMIAVDIDIKFCSNPNAFNCKSKGKTPVTIFGTADLDVTEIDISSLRLCIDGTCVESSPLAWSFADRGDPTIDLGAAECAIVEDEEQDYLNPDGYLDLDVAFNSQQIATLIDCSELVKNDVSDTLYLTGELVDGTPIESVPIDDPGIDQLVKKK